MATTLSHSESRRLYSWWWDSHITPNNSKWLKENLTDMDSKVKAMIKLIEEDADTFARRAEMYYKKRPELIKLVEGFYRAYRALAERYDHATVELHQAHCTIVEAIPDNESLLDPGALPTESRELSSAELSSRGLKQLSDIFASETMKGGEVDIHASAEVKALKQAISKLKECTELQYEVCSRRIAELELEISRAHEDVKRLSNEVQAGDAKLKCVEEECDLLAKTNQSLLLATGDLAEKIANKDQEVFHKGKELEALQTLLQDEQFRFTEAEASLKSLQKLHSQSQEEQKALASELDSKLQMLKDLETSNHDLEEFCQKIKDEKSTLLQERSNLLAQLQDAEIRLGDLEATFVKLEGKCNDLERDKDSALIQVKELQVFLSVEKQERASYAQSSESRIADLEKQVHSLQEERTSSKKESEKQLDRAVNAQVEILVLQKFIEDLKQKNLSLLFECQKANKLMSEFEAENLEQQEEIEFLLDEIETLRKGTNQVFSALQVYPVTKHNDGFDEEPIPFGLMLDVVKNLKCSFLKNDDEKQQLALENLVLCTFLKQLRLEGAELSSVSKSFEQDMIQQVIALEKDKFELLEKNEKLRVDANKQEEVLRAHLESQHLNLVSLEDSYQALREENFQLVQQNSSTSQNLADLEEKNGKLEEKLETKEAENSKLIENFEILHKKLNEGENLNDQLHCRIVIGKELLKQHVLELLQADQKLHVAENFNVEVCSTIKELKRKCASSNVDKKNMEIEILTLSENLVNQKEEIEGLRKTNEGYRMKEENLTLELHERVNKFELWESEASSFYFDLQACSIREVILENKVHELASACEHLEEMNVTKDAEIERMKGRFSSLESEIDGLKAQLSAYGPAIASLRKNVESLEHNALHANSSKARCAGSSGEDTALRAPEQIYQELEESRRGEVTNGISDLLKMQVRIETVEKAMVEQASRLKIEEVSVPEAHATTIRSKVKLDAPSGEAELWELKDWLTGRDNSFRKEARNALPGKDCDMSMKDIPLDQMLDRSSRSSSNMNSSTGSESVAEDQMIELYESVEPRFKRDPLSRSTRWKGVALSKSRSRRNVSQKRRDPPMEYQLEKEEQFQDGNTRKILERIESDAKKLMSVQLTVQELKSKMEAKKSKKKADNIESERVKRQLLEADEAILQLFSSTNQLARDIQETPLSSPSKSSSAYLEEADDAVKRRATERARRGSEKIGRLQFEVESIRYSVLQLEDDKKSKGKKHRFHGSRTILRDFVYSGRRNSIRRRNQNACFCGCGRPLTLEN